MTAGPELWLWRHPRCEHAAGRCIGRTDLVVDPRRAKRLAHRVRRIARREGLPREVWTSPLHRCKAVGRQLKRWGWRHRADARLLELDFGCWDGRPWQGIAHEDVAAWEAGFLDHAPGGGESLRSLMARVQAFIGEHGARAPLLVIAHAGWMQALDALQAHEAPSAARWPAAPPHGRLRRRALCGH